MEINKEFSKKTVLIAVIILLLIIVAPSFYFYNKYQKLKLAVSKPALLAKTEIQKLVEKVGKLIVLPKDEDPTLYTVTEIEKINNQLFFKNAKNGDKVLIYSKARKAILYDPQANKIVEVGPLVIPTVSAVVSPQAVSVSPPAVSVSPTAVITPISRPTSLVISPATVTNNLKIVIYNGTKTAGLASDAKDKINKELPELTVLATGNASGDYTENIIVDLKKSNTAIISKLKTLFAAKIVNTLPAGEKDAGADVVILLGK
jgi:hypothetical protein